MNLYMPQTIHSEARPRRKRRHPWAFPLGLAIIALAVTGAVMLISTGVNEIKKLTDDSQLKTKYETFLAPVVMNDPDPFDDISKANMSQLLDATIWALLKSNPDPDKYEYSEGNTVGIIVPKGDVEVQFERLFGTEVKPKHMTVEGNSYEFVYDEAKQSYIIPLTGVLPTYTPKVYKINKKGNSTILTVGYIGGSDWAQDEQGNFVAPKPGKYMKITLRENGKSYYISAIQATDAPEAADLPQKQADPLPTTTLPALSSTNPATNPNTTAPNPAKGK